MGRETLFCYNKWISQYTNMDQSPTTSVSDPSATLLEWSAPVRTAPVRSNQWYFAGGVLVLVGTVYGIFTGSWTFSVVCMLCGGIYVLLRDHLPPVKTITITRYGINFDGTFNGYGDMKSFWIIQTPLATELHIARKVRGPDIVIQTGQTDPTELRRTLSQYVREESDKQETFLDAIIRICKL